MEEEEEGYLFIVSPARGGSLLSGRLGTTPSPTEGSSRSKKPVEEPLFLGHAERHRLRGTAPRNR